MTDKRSDRDSLSLALQLLAKELGRRLQRHPSAHLLGDGGDSIELTLRLPTRTRPGWVEEAREASSASMDEALRRVFLHRRVFHIGHVYCLRCASASCEHAAPGRCGEVFAGYNPSGLPRFLAFGQWLLEQQDPRVDHLYRSPPGFVAHLTSGEILTHQLLPAFRDVDSGYHIHGQVAAGWYRIPDARGLLESVALTFQIVSSRPPKKRRRFGLNLIGVGPGDEPMENLFDRIGEIPWLDAARWAQRILAQVERSTRRRKAPTHEQLERRLHGLLNGLARRLERQQRARARRTRHGRKRHREPARPTWKALADLAEASDEHILFDTRNDTLIVLGDRGRAHVFNQAGRMVTSIRYSPGSIERRRKNARWRPATAEQVADLRERVRAAPDLDTAGRATPNSRP